MLMNSASIKTQICKVNRVGEKNQTIGIKEAFKILKFLLLS